MKNGHRKVENEFKKGIVKLVKIEMETTNQKRFTRWKEKMTDRYIKIEKNKKRKYITAHKQRKKRRCGDDGS